MIPNRSLDVSLLTSTTGWTVYTPGTAKREPVPLALTFTAISFQSKNMARPEIIHKNLHARPPQACTVFTSRFHGSSKYVLRIVREWSLTKLRKPKEGNVNIRTLGFLFFAFVGISACRVPANGDNSTDDQTRKHPVLILTKPTGTIEDYRKTFADLSEGLGDTYNGYTLVDPQPSIQVPTSSLDVIWRIETEETPASWTDKERAVHHDAEKTELTERLTAAFSPLLAQRCKVVDSADWIGITPAAAGALIDERLYARHNG